MAKISQKELNYIKETISPAQLIDLVSLKAKMNKRKIKAGQKIDESFGVSKMSNGIQEFYSNSDNGQQEIFNEVFDFYANTSVAMKRIIEESLWNCINSIEHEIVLQCDNADYENYEAF